VINRVQVQLLATTLMSSNHGQAIHTQCSMVLHFCFVIVIIIIVVIIINSLSSLSSSVIIRCKVDLWEMWHHVFRNLALSITCSFICWPIISSIICLILQIIIIVLLSDDRYVWYVIVCWTCWWFQFDPLLVESRQAETCVLMLDSSEEDVVIKAAEAIYKFVEKCKLSAIAFCWWDVPIIRGPDKMPPDKMPLTVEFVFSSSNAVSVCLHFNIVANCLTRKNQFKYYHKFLFKTPNNNTLFIKTPTRVKLLNKFHTIK